MKRFLIIACTLAAITGCASGKKHFTVVTEPPDAEIIVIPGGNEPEQKLAAPAKVTVRIPSNPRLAANSRMEVKRDKYKSKIVSLEHIDEGQEVKVKLEKIVHYLLKFTLLSPQHSDNLTYRDRVLAASFSVRERQFEMTLQNLSPKPLKILWEQASYTDHVNRQHRLMHGGVKMQDRSNPIPPQVIKPGETLTQGIAPVSLVTYSPEKKSYENKILFPVDSDLAQALKGRVYYLFLPVEMDRQIIPYNFKFQITDAIKES
jgi:hypothetical protein